MACLFGRLRLGLLAGRRCIAQIALDGADLLPHSLRARRSRSDGCCPRPQRRLEAQPRGVSILHTQDAGRTMACRSSVTQHPTATFWQQQSVPNDGVHGTSICFAARFARSSCSSIDTWSWSPRFSCPRARWRWAGGPTTPCTWLPAPCSHGNQVVGECTSHGM